GPYGELATSTGTATTPLRFAGEYTDAETGFVYLRARYYDPATGQFLTRDPLVDLTREPYSYVRGNPLNATDPLGLFCVGSICTPKGIGGALGGAWDATAGKAVTFVDNHRDAFSTGLALVGGIACGVAAGAATGGLAAPACYSLTVAALGLSARDSYVDNDPAGFLIDVGLSLVPFAGGADELLVGILSAGSGALGALLNFIEAIGGNAC
ncbi:MAG: RHS repeat-associated core domain-containing protein, partial [Actinomycetota bacterium]